MKKDIESRTDISKLVNSFYGKVRKDQTIGPFFNETISDWPEHLEKLTNFWETNLLFVQAYKGNPIKAHIDVDASFNNRIQQAHFNHWLEIWHETVDELFEGKNANLAKDRARNMANIMFIRIFQARETHP